MKNRGFTVMELMVVLGLVGIAALGSFNVLAYFRLQYSRTFMLSDARLSVTLGERFLYMHAKNAYPSFNNLKVSDDNNRNFYDLNTEYPINLVAQPTRTLTLREGGTMRLYMIVADSRQGPPIYIDPVRLFTATQAAAGTPGVLTYQGLTNNGYIQELSRKLNPADAGRPLWQDGNVLYVYTPATLRPAQAADSDFVSPYCFFGLVQGQSLLRQNFGGLVKCVNPVDTSEVQDLQDFMVKLPSQAGGIPVVLLRSVSVLRYDLVPAAEAGHFNLVFSKWDGANFTDSQLAAVDICQVVFERPSVADSVISVKVVPGTLSTDKQGQTTCKNGL